MSRISEWFSPKIDGSSSIEMKKLTEPKETTDVFVSTLSDFLKSEIAEEKALEVRAKRLKREMGLEFGLDYYIRFLRCKDNNDPSLFFKDFKT